jgi:hypothetical protein
MLGSTGHRGSGDLVDRRALVAVGRSSALSRGRWMKVSSSLSTTEPLSPCTCSLALSPVGGGGGMQDTEGAVLELTTPTATSSTSIRSWARVPV